MDSNRQLPTINSKVSNQPSTSTSAPLLVESKIHPIHNINSSKETTIDSTKNKFTNQPLPIPSQSTTTTSTQSTTTISPTLLKLPTSSSSTTTSQIPSTFNKNNPITSNNNNLSENENINNNNDNIGLEETLTPSSSSSNTPESSRQSPKSISGKIFVGGIPKSTSNEKLKKYFSEFGVVKESIVIKSNEKTIKSRGFGFVTFTDPSIIDHLLTIEHIIDGKTVEIRRAIPKEVMEEEPVKQKLFIGGLPKNITPDEFKNYFLKYGEISESNLLMEKNGTVKGFGFICFNDESLNPQVLAESHFILGKKVDVRIAESKKGGGSIQQNQQSQPGILYSQSKGGGLPGSVRGSPNISSPQSPIPLMEMNPEMYDMYASQNGIFSGYQMQTPQSTGNPYGYPTIMVPYVYHQPQYYQEQPTSQSAKYNQTPILNYPPPIYVSHLPPPPYNTYNRYYNQRYFFPVPSSNYSSTGGYEVMVPPPPPTVPPHLQPQLSPPQHSQSQFLHSSFGSGLPPPPSSQFSSLSSSSSTPSSLSSSGSTPLSHSSSNINRGSKQSHQTQIPDPPLSSIYPQEELYSGKSSSYGSKPLSTPSTSSSTSSTTTTTTTKSHSN
eukprot:gene6112-7617_t